MTVTPQPATVRATLSLDIECERGDLGRIFDPFNDSMANRLIEAFAEFSLDSGMSFTVDGLCVVTAAPLTDDISSPPTHSAPS